MLFRNPVLQIVGAQLAGLLASPQQGHVAVHAARDGTCPILGAVLPPPRSPSTHPAVAAAKAALKENLDGLLGQLNGSLALSVEVKSIHENASLFEYHATPRALDPRGVQNVTGDSVYRIASITKILPVMALLLLDGQGVRMQDPVTKYLPGLRELNNQPAEKDELTTVDWDEITLEALASHLSGINPEFSADLSSLPPFDPESVGLPARGPDDIPACSGLVGTRPCTAQDFYAHFGKAPPVFAPFNQPVYSNVAFAILGFVVEQVSGKPFADFTKEKILDPLGLKDIYATTPDDSRGVITPGDVFWNASLGFVSPGGNYYASTRDLTALMEGILTNKLLSPAKTRRWLKPLSSTSSAGTMVGAPWEIFRAENVTADQRMIELYTKNGGLGTYASIVVAVPDYGLAVTVLAAGAEAGLGPALGGIAVLRALLPALEAAGKDEARPRFAGSYADAATNSTLVLSLDAADLAPGVRVGSFVARGVDFLATALGISPFGSGSGGEQSPPPPPPRASLRLYPAGLGNGARVGWRALVGMGGAAQAAASDAIFPWPQGSCSSWGAMGRPGWELNSLDSFVFNLGPDGVATSIELPAFKLKLKRQQ